MNGKKEYFGLIDEFGKRSQACIDQPFLYVLFYFGELSIHEKTTYCFAFSCYSFIGAGPPLYHLKLFFWTNRFCIKYLPYFGQAVVRLSLGKKEARGFTGVQFCSKPKKIRSFLLNSFHFATTRPSRRRQFCMSLSYMFKLENQNLSRLLRGQFTRAGHYKGIWDHSISY